MKFVITLHIIPAGDPGQPGDWTSLIKATLEQIPGVREAEVEPESVHGAGDQ